MQVIITTGGTGISSRDSTYESVSALLQKRLDGFGELFRMLSYQEIGSAAMMSRASAGLASGKIVVSLPGSEAAVRLAMERLLIPELGHLVQQAASRMKSARAMRPFTSTISLDEARRRLDANVRPIERDRTRAPRTTAAGRVAAADVASPIDVPPFARSAMDGYAVVAADTDGASRDAPVRLRQLDRILHRNRIDADRHPRHVRRDRHRRPAAGRRGRGRDGRGVGEGGRRARSISSRPRRAGQNIGKRGADIHAGDRVIASGDLRHTRPRRGARRHRSRRRGGVREAARCDSLDRQRGRRTRARRFGPDRSTTSTASRSAPSSPRTAACPSGSVRRRTRSTRCSRALDECATADLIVFSGGSSVGDRDLVVDAIARARRDDLSRHRRQARQADGLRARRSGTPFFGMPGNPTSCLSNAYILLVPFLRAIARLPPYAPHTCACRSAGASCRP